MITFANIPDLRTPGVYVEVDASRALKGLQAHPHSVLLIGQRESGSGTIPIDTLVQITSDGLADGYFGAGSLLARMCNVFKDNNQNTEVWAMALSANGGTQASARIHFSVAFSGGMSVTREDYLYMMINGYQILRQQTSAWSAVDTVSDLKTYLNSLDWLPVTASRVIVGDGNSDLLVLSAKVSGTPGNYLDVRFNYYGGQSYPRDFNDSALISGFEGGGIDPNLADAWAVIDGMQFHYIVQPWIDAINLTAIENELADRYGPLIDLQGHGLTAVRGANASCTTLGNSRNSPHNTIIGFYDSPTDPAEWAAALGAITSKYLEADPARPLHYLRMVGVLPPPQENRWNRAERDILLYDGITTYIVDSGGGVLLERVITTYQKNAVGVLDPTYLDINTLATIESIRYQFKARMLDRFILPRFKLADDSFPVQPGTYVATPKTVRQEIIALFTELRDAGLIDNLSEFIINLKVERDGTDKNRVNVLLPPDLINQFRVLAGVLQFIL